MRWGHVLLNCRITRKKTNYANLESRIRVIRFFSGDSAVPFVAPPPGSLLVAADHTPDIGSPAVADPRGARLRDEIRNIQALMEQQSYVSDRGIATAVYLATALKKPLLVEGHPGVGKTDIAKVLARALDADRVSQSRRAVDWRHARSVRIDWRGHGAHPAH